MRQWGDFDLLGEKRKPINASNIVTRYRQDFKKKDKSWTQSPIHINLATPGRVLFYRCGHWSHSDEWELEWLWGVEWALEVSNSWAFFSPAAHFIMSSCCFRITSQNFNSCVLNFVHPFKLDFHHFLSLLCCHLFSNITSLRCTFLWHILFFLLRILFLSHLPNTIIWLVLLIPHISTTSSWSFSGSSKPKWREPHGVPSYGFEPFVEILCVFVFLS